MNDVVADTQPIVWFFHDPAKLSLAADAALSAAEQHGTIFISAITLVEVAYLETKASFPHTGVLQNLFQHVTDPTSPVKVFPLAIDVARAILHVSRNEVPDMPDRIVCATAVAHRLPVVSSDTEIRNSPSLKTLVAVVW
jgi:PIN domain nuclease of toxin-antitoxin system